MATTVYWSPNQAAIAQVETYTFSAPIGVGNTYTAAINGKTVTYRSVSGDTAATAATALFNLLSASIGVAPELAEITFANPSAGVITATARAPGTPFANLAGGLSPGLVLSTGNGLTSGIATAHTQPNASPSDAADPQNWLRTTGAGPGARALPQTGDDMVVAGGNVPLLWNLDQLAAIQLNTYTRWQSFAGTVGLPDVNPGGYVEWRATYLKLGGPAGSVPAGGLVMVLGFNSGSGDGPGRERYDVGSQKVLVQALAAGGPLDEYGIRFLGVHTDNVINANGGVTVGVAVQPGESAQLNAATVAGGATLAVGARVAWTASTAGTPSSCTAYGGSVVLNAAPASLTLDNGAAATIATDALVWPLVVAQGGCTLAWNAGGVITSLVLSQGCTLDKGADVRPLTITNATLDGDSCVVNDPNNAVAFTNAATVKQQVGAGPFRFTGPRSVKVT